MSYYTHSFDVFDPFKKIIDVKINSRDFNNPDYQVICDGNTIQVTNNRKNSEVRFTDRLLCSLLSHNAHMDYCLNECIKKVA